MNASAVMSAPRELVNQQDPLEQPASMQESVPPASVSIAFVATRSAMADAKPVPPRRKARVPMELVDRSKMERIPIVNVQRNRHPRAVKMGNATVQAHVPNTQQVPNARQDHAAGQTKRMRRNATA
jgi:hypothetical protein